MAFATSGKRRISSTSSIVWLIGENSRGDGSGHAVQRGLSSHFSSAPVMTRRAIAPAVTICSGFNAWSSSHHKLIDRLISSGVGFLLLPFSSTNDHGTAFETAVWPALIPKAASTASFNE